MKRLLSLVASAAILSFTPQVARPGALYDAVITGDFCRRSATTLRAGSLKIPGTWELR